MYSRNLNSNIFYNSIRNLPTDFCIPFKKFRQIVQRISRSYVSVPNFPDPPCMDIDPKCHHIEQRCTAARNALKYELPYSKEVVEMQKNKPFCCVARFAHKVPCKDFNKKKKKEKKKKPFVSMWEPPCEPREQPYCKDKLPRFDEMYYTPSCKTRCYQRTWVECPRKRLRKKKVCCLDGIEPPEVMYREYEICPKVACEMDCERFRNICGNRDDKYLCPKTLIPYCTPARCPPKCTSERLPSDCEKLKAPYPSFSEARKPSKRPLRGKECDCITTANQCEVFKEQHRREMFDIKQL